MTVMIMNISSRIMQLVVEIMRTLLWKTRDILHIHMVVHIALEVQVNVALVLILHLQLQLRAIKLQYMGV